MVKKLMVAVIALALCSGAFAQGGRMMRMGNDPARLLGRTDVQKDLGLTDDQVTKIKAVQDKAREDMMAFFQANMQGGPPDQAAMEKLRPQMEKMRADVKKQIDAIITADQSKRLDQISIQLDGNRAVLRKEVQDQLSLTDDQKSKLKTLQTNEQTARQEVMQKMRDGEITRDQIGDIMTKNNKIMNDEIGKVLTDDQKTKLKTLGGKEFKAEPQDDGGQN